MAFYTITPFMGPILGPLMGGLVSQICLLALSDMVLIRIRFI
jgi:hypothetical protein